MPAPRDKISEHDSTLCGYTGCQMPEIDICILVQKVLGAETDVAAKCAMRLG